MKCTSCGRDLGPPPTVCRPCGKRFVPRKKADVHLAKTQPAPIQRGTPDLHSMPTRPTPRARRAEPGLHDMATQPAPVKRPVRRRSEPVPKKPEPSGKGRRNVLLLGGILAVAMGGGVFTWRILNAPPADIQQEEVYVIRPASQEHRTIDRFGDFSYRLEVTAMDGPLNAVMGGVSNPSEPQPIELEKLVADGRKPANVIRSGQSRVLEGVVRNAYPIWFIFNFDDGKSARARVRFVLKEQ